MRFIPATAIALLSLVTVSLSTPNARYSERDLYPRDAYAEAHPDPYAEAYANAYADAYEDVYTGLQARDLSERDPFLGFHMPKSNKIHGHCGSPKKSYPESMGGGRNARMFCVIPGGVCTSCTEGKNHDNEECEC